MIPELNLQVDLNLRIKKQQKNFTILIKVSMGQLEKAASSCYLGNYRFLRLGNEDKTCVESKTSEKNYNFCQKIYGLPIKSYIIIVLQKDYEDKSRLE